LGDRVLNDPKFHSPETQIAAIDAELNERFGSNWKLAPIEGNYGTATFADFNVSGRSMVREGLDAAIKAAETTGATAIGVLNLSRWGRSVSKALMRINDLKEKGVVVYSANERLDHRTAEGSFLLTMWLAMAQLYADQKGEDWSRLIEKRAEGGEHHGAPPIGFCRQKLPNGKTAGRLLPNAAKAVLIQEAFRMYASGASKMSVGRMLVTNSLVSAPTQARPILENRIYRKSHSADCPRHCQNPVSHGEYGEVRASDFDENTSKIVGIRWFPGKHVGLVDADLFDKVQKRLRASKTGTAHREVSDVRHPLQGLVRCVKCGRAMALDKTPDGYQAYRDHSGKAIGCEGPGVVNAERVLAVVQENVSALLKILDLTQVIKGRSTKRSSLPTGSADAEKIVKNREKRIDLLAMLQNQIALGEVDNDEVSKSRIQNLKIQITSFDTQLTELTVPKPSIDISQIRTLIKEAESSWTSKSPATQRRIISQLITAVYVDRRDPKGKWRQDYRQRVIVEPIPPLRPSNWQLPTPKVRKYAKRLKQ